MLALLEVSQARQEVKFEIGWSGSVVNQIGGVLAPLTHVDRAKVQRGLLAASLFENDGEVLLDAGRLDVHGAMVKCAIDLNGYLF